MLVYERFENALICIISIGPSARFTPISNFPIFRENGDSLERLNIFLKIVYQKGFYDERKKKFEFLQLAPDSRKLLTTALKLIKSRLRVKRFDAGFYIVQDTSLAVYKFCAFFISATAVKFPI